MTGRVLVVDDVPANVKLLEARLAAEYFTVLTAASGPEALRVLDAERVDIVLLDVMMPGMDGFEVCRRIKALERTAHVPVVIITALDQAADKVQGLAAGADDFLTKPLDDIALLTRVRNLVRLKALADELMLRCATGAARSAKGVGPEECGSLKQPGRILLVEDQPASTKRVTQSLAGVHTIDVEVSPERALARLAAGTYELLIVSLNLLTADGLRLCGQVRAVQALRDLPILLLVRQGDEVRLLRGLEMGVNDYVMRPVDGNELLARVRTQIRRKRHCDWLRARLDESVESAMTDALTGLHNRRFLEQHLEALAEEAKARSHPLALLVIDIDHFKAINDDRGHAAGDDVLRQFALRLRRNARARDLTCRLGGEEFVVVMPQTNLAEAQAAAERLRAATASDPFRAGSGSPLAITASVGLATTERGAERGEDLLRRADVALYAAKKRGRNRVAADAA